MEKKSATRLDIARRAGTSVSVVSRALNNSGYAVSYTHLVIEDGKQ